jgi:hypothetical protein
VTRRIQLLRPTTLYSVAALLVVASSLIVASRGGPASIADREAARAGGNPEAQEQATDTTLREIALADAQAAGVAGRTGPALGRAADGWAGERLMGRGDDWEPAVAADPNAPYVYLSFTRYGGPRACGKCPSPNIILRRSDDDGRTWLPAQFLCPCRGWGGQYDPIIEVVPDTGDVVAVWMNGFHVFFSRSSDHGATWSEAVRTYGTVATVRWNDKPVLAVSDDGQDVYVSLNGPDGGDPWAMQSHDGGATWTQTKLVESQRYYFAFDADVLHDGTVIFSESSLDYTEPGRAPTGEIRHHAFISRDDGATWERHLIDGGPVGEPCVADGCSPDFYYGHPVVTADDDGSITILYDSATRAGGPQRIWARHSTDGGLTWSDRRGLSTLGHNSTSPAVEATGAGDIRAWYMQERTGPNSWNVWYRESRNGGDTWKPAVKISDASTGAGYKRRGGFFEVYGDYGEIAITSSGHTIAAWGEGFSWIGPGGIWMNRGR